MLLYKDFHWQPVLRIFACINRLFSTLNIVQHRQTLLPCLSIRLMPLIRRTFPLMTQHEPGSRDQERRHNAMFCLDSESSPLQTRPLVILESKYWPPTVIQTSIVYTWVVAISTKYFKLWKMCFYSVCQTCPASQVNLESGFLLRMPPSPSPAQPSASAGAVTQNIQTN